MLIRVHICLFSQPIFVVGRKVDHLRGSFFSLLSDAEAEEVRVVILIMFVNIVNLCAH